MKSDIENFVLSYVIPLMAIATAATHVSKTMMRTYGFKIFFAYTYEQNFSTVDYYSGSSSSYPSSFSV